MNTMIKLKVTGDNGNAVIEMDNNEIVNSLVICLPLTLRFEDINLREKYIDFENDRLSYASCCNMSYDVFWGRLCRTTICFICKKPGSHIFLPVRMDLICLTHLKYWEMSSG